MDRNATKLTALLAVWGMVARRSISLATGGQVATTYPVSTTMAICRVNAVRSQKPSPKAFTTVCGEEPLASAATATRTTPTRAKTYASGNHFSVQPANDWATRASPFSERDSSVADVIRPFLFPFPARCTRPARQDVGVGRDGPAGVERV